MKTSNRHNAKRARPTDAPNHAMTVQQSCLGKVGFWSRADAKYAISQMKSHGMNHTQALRAYRCPLCDWFHIGTQTGRTRAEHRAFHQEAHG